MDLDGMVPDASHFPKAVTATGDCESRVAGGPHWCQHRQDYVIEVYSPGMQQWQTLRVCTPCCATLRAGAWQVRRVSNARSD
jgi:hypothetical protein